MPTQQSVRPPSAGPAPVEQPPPPRIRAILGSGWLPAALLAIVTALTLRHYEVPLVQFAAFTVYIGLAITLPGVLLWRLITGGSRLFVEDVAAGTALGYTVEVLTYLVGRAIGVPLLVVVPPIAVVLAFAVVPGLRRHWAGPGRSGRAPALWSWAMASVLGLLLLWSSAKFFSSHGLTWPFNASPDHDMPFHMAILGELKHHLPPETPFVQGEPLLYHWFVYAEMAATSWVTGIEPQTLLYRLGPLPMLTVFTLLIGVIAHRLTKRWWTGPVAAVSTFFVLAPNPYGWSLPKFFTSMYGFGVVDDASLLRPVMWTSPTQTFGAVLFAAVVLVLIDLLGEHAGDWRRWSAFGALTVAVMGAKATYLPLMTMALFFVIVVSFAFTRRLHRPALLALAVSICCLAFAQIVLFGGAAQGLHLDPFSTMRVWAMSEATGFATGSGVPVWRLLLLTALFAVCWIAIWAGIGALGRRLAEPPVLLLCGLGLGGIGAITVFGHAGLSQGFFFQSARPYLAIAAVAGIATLVPKLTVRAAAMLAGAVVAGVVVVRLVRFVDGSTVPSMSSGAVKVAIELVIPYAILAVVVAVAGFVLWRMRARLSAGLPVALVLALMAGFGLGSGVQRVRDAVSVAAEANWRSDTVEGWSMPDGLMDAGRWLRDHSSAGDLVATNAHCQVPNATPCHNGHVWMAGYSERRMLVEGWAFTNRVHALAIETGMIESEVPYWRPELLADNDRVFSDPDEQSVRKLRDGYGVRWLFVDERYGTVSPRLGAFADLRFRAGPCAIYELRR